MIKRKTHPSAMICGLITLDLFHWLCCFRGRMATGTLVLYLTLASRLFGKLVTCYLYIMSL